MHRRFSRARTLSARVGDSPAFDVVVADSVRLRLLGLMGVARGGMPTAVFFPRCRSLHTFWMRSAIDVAWLRMEEESARVLDVTLAAPRRTLRVRCPRRQTCALELPPGTATTLGIRPGRTIVFEG